MLFEYALASVLLVSAVIGHAPVPKEISYVESEVKTQADHTAVTAGIEQSSLVIGDDRVSNLKYVLAIQNSSIWTDVKRRTLTISTNPRLTEILSESPEKLSDGDLALLKKSCQDGLKCVAVDQLLVLKSATETSDGGKVSVRKVITKITQVLTKYTTEYHEDTYQYVEVTESDDQSKVNETVTVMVEDNKELCRLNLGNDSIVVQNETQSTTVKKDSQNVYSGTASSQVNKGNVASVLVDDKAFGSGPNKNTDRKNDDTLTTNSQTRSSSDLQNRDTNNDASSHVAVLVGVMTPESDSDKSLVVIPIAPEDNNKPELLNGDATRGTGAPERKTRNHSTQDRHVANDDKPIGVTSPSLNGASTSGASAAAVDASVKTRNSKPNDVNSGPLKSILVSDGSAGQDHGKTAYANMGDVNVGNSRGGYTKDGTINNGEMKVYNINNISLNEGTINKSSSDGGVVDIGALNNGPTNYGKVEDYKNNGTMTSMDTNNMQRYLVSVDQMYSAIIDGLGK